MSLITLTKVLQGEYCCGDGEIISSIRDRTIYIGRSGVSVNETVSQEPVG